MSLLMLVRKASLFSTYYVQHSIMDSVYLSDKANTPAPKGYEP